MNRVNDEIRKVLVSLFGFLVEIQKVKGTKVYRVVVTIPANVSWGIVKEVSYTVIDRLAGSVLGLRYVVNVVG